MSDDTKAGTSDTPEWAYFDEALCWYPGHNLTGAQRLSVVQQIRRALADGRITPDDLGFAKADPFGSGHGTGCGHRYGHACDCTARSATYWQAPTPSNDSTGGTP